jgi:hypothetical protein
MVQRQKRIAAIALVYLTFQALCFGQSTFNINLDAIRNSVVFMYLRGPDGSLKDAGTGFLLLVPSKAQPDRAYTMLVTARHIADPGWAGSLGMQGTLFAVLTPKRQQAIPLELSRFLCLRFGFTPLTTMLMSLSLS